MKYQINPIIVDAVKIAGVGENLPNGSFRVLLEGQGPSSHGTVVIKSEMMGVPKVGDYLVTNEDGTRNLVPKAPFEATHTCVEEGLRPELSNEQINVLGDHVPLAAEPPFTESENAQDSIKDEAAPDVETA